MTTYVRYPTRITSQAILLEQLAIDDAEAFEFEGVTITDRNKSPCGRFDLTPQQSKDLYGE